MYEYEIEEMWAENDADLTEQEKEECLRLSQQAFFPAIDRPASPKPSAPFESFLEELD